MNKIYSHNEYVFLKFMVLLLLLFCATSIILAIPSKKSKPLGYYVSQPESSTMYYCKDLISNEGPLVILQNCKIVTGYSINPNLVDQLILKEAVISYAYPDDRKE